jgi:hypothetical protein
MEIPEPQYSIQALIDKVYEENAEPPRPHMGVSQLGHQCDRWLWLAFRWAVKPEFPGRILRLFRRGKLEEETIIADLRLIGIEVTGTQDRVDFGKHVSGSLDGIINSGVPEAPKKRHVVEFKTHSLKSFESLVKEGVYKSKFEHFVQMQVYMHGTGIDRALYIAVCKNDDRIYTERVHYNKETALRYIERGQRLAMDNRMPPPITKDPTWYLCRMCPAHSFCHETHLTKEVNCRTCAHSTPMTDSTWRCERFDADGIPVEFQRTGCDCHVLHPDLVPWERVESKDPWVAVYLINGAEVANGEVDVNVYSSKEIVKNPACQAGIYEEFIDSEIKDTPF